MSKYLTFGVVGIAILLGSMGAYAVSVAFPDITSSFNVSITTAGWILTAFQLAMIVTMPVAGKASDTLGRKRTFIFFVLLFTVGTFLCAIAPNIYWLIAFRVVQGIGGGGFMGPSAGIVAEAFPKSRQRAIGLIVTLGTVGIAFGLNIGGWLTESFGWRSVFWGSIAVSAVTLLAGAIVLKQDGTMQKVDIDLYGAGLLAASLGTIMLGLTTLETHTARAFAAAFGFLAVGAILTLVFIRHERRAKSPIIPIEVLKGKPFVAANLFNLVFGFMLGVLTFVPLYAVTIYDVSISESGLIATPRTAGMLVASIASSLLLVRWGYRRPLMIGVLSLVVGCTILGFELSSLRVFGAGLSGIGIALVAVTFAGFGHGFSSPAANNACIELMPDRVSTITGMRQTFRTAGQATGIALASLVLGSFSNLESGFRVVFFGTALVGLVSIPSIFAMPRSAADAGTNRSRIAAAESAESG